jgi:hypothetical protein
MVTAYERDGHRSTYLALSAFIVPHRRNHTEAPHKSVKDLQA